MSVFQNARDEIVTVREQIDGNRHGFSDAAFDRKPPAVDLGLEPLDDQASSVGNIAIIAGVSLQPGPGSGFVRLTWHTHD